MPESVNHPTHYGGEDNPYETIKVIEAWGWGTGFCLGNAIKYISRAGNKGNRLEDLRKAAWYLQREIEREMMTDEPERGSDEDSRHGDSV